MTEGERFEQWWEKHGFNIVGLNIDVKDIVWQGWQAARRWIPVGEEWPKIGGDSVYGSKPILGTDGLDVYICKYVQTKNNWWFQELEAVGMKNSIKITHWQPLPEPPEEDHK